jgi:two-component system osmolarity sensor histidine kinase EnvZ
LRSDVAEMEHMVNGYLDFVRGEGAETPVETALSDAVAWFRQNGYVRKS